MSDVGQMKHKNQPKEFLSSNIVSTSSKENVTEICHCQDELWTNIWNIKFQVQQQEQRDYLNSDTFPICDTVQQQNLKSTEGMEWKYGILSNLCSHLNS